MDCNVVKDLIPLYIDDCCSKESAAIVKEHIESCSSCRNLYEEMKKTPDVTVISVSPVIVNKLNDWRASVMQSISLFLSFILIAVGVSMEASTPSGMMNGFWALNLVAPATGFMLSLANWYFIRLYRNKSSFSRGSLFTTIGITVCAYIWAVLHYEISIIELLSNFASLGVFNSLHRVVTFAGIGIVLTAVFCVLSKHMSSKYAKMLGKE